MAEKVPTRNSEGLPAYNITWPWDRGAQQTGIGGVLRVRNEARNLPHVLPPLLEAGVNELHVVDNGSTDSTLEVARAVVAHAGQASRLFTHAYPHRVSRCGPEHLATSPASLASLAYFYNWAFSLPQTTYALKWDGDMVLTPLGIEHLQHLRPKLLTTPTVLRIPRHPLYLKNENEAWLDLGWRNVEAFGWPIAPDYVHGKAWDWELPLWPADVKSRTLRRGSCLELKWLEDDEFSHWTHTDFTAGRNRRKRREYLIHTSLAAGQRPAVEGLVPIVSPTSTHIVDYVKNTWLPQAPRPLVGSAIRDYPALTAG